ncbi:MAG: RNA polymerase sigma-70 factor [Flavobacteriia bacterium]|nr:RNA polymerase sigma-70 factor [Flavobacteriia bacterium]OIP46759.1 MAG: RNA polymerase subunit sigma-70 [Flavobacteriaceae bacterium CG2_30_31_66]PIV95815.1 MAG: RNA polymerase subunit sigma-70 [Flavobacteriaceae bacterium CG17_big_fil_post_rev_8_21_14_2_50_31_13]PIX14824.1 MAG: RNA polymerase subunit sigma-70 [Flavobacteriaceae bacterium CG_4_8_14_3_um_filter_31_8]PIY16116.1 MAG: RNA polymerase subunit sigma-70 [Flavobacteriaceae bacterium CG_4_10_14_3_um_filter_31_253]PIZ11330.1 MAG: RNA
MNHNSKNICNDQVFETVFRTHAKNLKRFIYSKTRDEDLAEDIIQDAFVKIWEDCDKVVFDTVKSYLYTISNNLFLNIMKHNKVVQNHQKIKVDETSIESPEFLMLSEEFLIKLEKAIADLSEKQRDVFLMNRIEKMKYKEIAEKLEISQKAVEKRMHEALLVMREKIGNI